MGESIRFNHYLSESYWMTDTPEEIEVRYRQMILARSGEDRVKMGCSMHATAQALVRASGEAKGKTLTPQELRRLLFIRFYEHEFEPKTCQKILTNLEKVHDP